MAKSVPIESHLVALYWKVPSLFSCFTSINRSSLLHRLKSLDATMKRVCHYFVNLGRGRRFVFDLKELQKSQDQNLLNGWMVRKINPRKN